MLRDIGQLIGLPLALPAVAVHLHSESKGWLANDTAALRVVAPNAVLHLDSSPSATINSLVLMARSDILIMGASGFSVWSGLLSCGVKLGPIVSNLALPFRHVNYSNTLRRHFGPFRKFAGAPSRRRRAAFGCQPSHFISCTIRPRVLLPMGLSIGSLRAMLAVIGDTFTRAWREYWGCKLRTSCRRTLCAPHHITDRRWLDPPLAQPLVGELGSAQWHVPAWAADELPTEFKAQPQSCPYRLPVFSQRRRYE